MPEQKKIRTLEFTELMIRLFLEKCKFRIVKDIDGATLEIETSERTYCIVMSYEQYSSMRDLFNSVGAACDDFTSAWYEGHASGYYI